MVPASAPRLWPHHPALTCLAPSALGLALGGAAAWGLGVYMVDVPLEDGGLFLTRMAREPWQALSLGIAWGLPFVFVEVVALYAWRDHFAEAPFRTSEERRALAARLRNACAWVPTVVALGVAAFAAWGRIVSIPVAVFGALVPLALAYPMERHIYTRMRDRATREARPS